MREAYQVRGELLLHGRLRLPQAYVDANEWAVDVDAEIRILRLGQVGIGYVHICRSGFNAGPGVEVIARSAAHHQGECQVLALGIEYPVRSLGVDVPDTSTHFIVGNNPPVTRYKVAPDAIVEGYIASLRPSWNYGERTAEGKIKGPPMPSNCQRREAMLGCIV
jgi:hypothetical protein